MTRTRLVLQVAAMSLLIALAIPLLSSAHPIYPIAHASSKTISLVANIGSGGYYYWNTTNPTITVTQGDSITIDLSSSGVTHRFLLDFDNDGLDTSDCSSTGDPCSSAFSTSATVPTFTANTIGSFNYYCTIHYPYMTGQFIVQPATTPDFSIASNPTSLTFLQGSSSTSTVTVTSRNGFSGKINLSATSSPTGLTISLNPTSVTISSGTSQTSTLSVNSTTSMPSGSYTVTVTGTNGTLPHTTVVSVTINPPASKDFSIRSNPSSLSIASGSTGTTTITLTSLNGFSGTITLTGAVSPSGPTVSFSSASLAISGGGSAMSTLTVSAAPTGLYSAPVSNGDYLVTITATSGSLSHSTTMQVTVGSSGSSGSGALSLPLTVGIGVAVVIVAAIAVTVFLVKRKPK